MSAVERIRKIKSLDGNKRRGKKHITQGDKGVIYLLQHL